MTTQNPAVPNGGELKERDPDSIGPTSSAVVPSTVDGGVLLVGDERCTARLLEPWVSEAFATRTVATTERAPEEVTTTPVGIVVVDTVWLRDGGGEFLRQLRRAEATCLALLLNVSATTAFRTDHCVRLPADGETACDAIATARQVGADEQTIETLLAQIDRRRALERNGERAGAEYRRVQRHIGSLHARLDNTLDGVEHRYVEPIDRQQDVPSAGV